MSVLLVTIADVDETGVASFQAYEANVLPLLRRHGGRLERRLRTDDGRTEVHIVSFETEEGLESFGADPERQAHRRLLAGVDVVQRVARVYDV